MQGNRLEYLYQVDKQIAPGEAPIHAPVPTSKRPHKTTRTAEESLLQTPAPPRDAVCPDGTGERTGGSGQGPCCRVACATRVESELTEEKTEPLRSELSQIPKAYPATYGVVVFDPSSGERLAMDADRRSLALLHREYRIQRYSGWHVPLLDA